MGSASRLLGGRVGCRLGGEPAARDRLPDAADPLGRLGLGPKLGLSVPLMGLPFLILALTAAVPVVLLVIAVFVVGEMLWAPGSEALVVNMAPPGLRGPTGARRPPAAGRGAR